MSSRIGIVGAGTAGLHLALYLQRHGIQATVITDRRAEEYEASRLLNTVAHHAETIARERALGLTMWDHLDATYGCHHHFFGLPGHPLAFRGDFTSPSRAIDYRLYLPELMRQVEAGGGRFEYRTIEESDVAGLAERFDLLVVATGKSALARLFKPVETPFPVPQRHMCVGLYTGVRDSAPRGVTLSVSPGVCDLIEIPTLTFGGMATALLFEIVPGSEMEDLYRLRYDADPRGFLNKVLGHLERHHPTVYDRVDRQSFALCRPLDLLQGAILPTVRETAVQLGGTTVVSAGDVHMTLDPVTGQGANMASFGAWVLGEEIVQQPVFDQRFVEKVARRREERVLSAFRWTNAFLVPPTPELVGLILEMAQNQALADEFTANFNFPERQWDHLATGERIQSWLAAHRPARA
jgi:2-polyprenyl-6-methoxyphenol hydroxylase-like FAD-dependent oxidoreductase